MATQSYSMEEDHISKLDDLCKNEMRKPSQMIQVLITRAHKDLEESKKV